MLLHNSKRIIIFADEIGKKKNGVEGYKQTNNAFFAWF